MNTVTSSGGTKSQRELATAVVEFCISELMPRHRTLDIEIELKPTIFETDAAALCYPNTENSRPRDFVVEVDSRIWKPLSKKWARKDARDDFIAGVCHEMVHVWQWVKGDLKDVYDRKLGNHGYRQMWKGKDYTDTPYSKLPWERQAYRMQETLLNKFKNSIREG